MKRLLTICAVVALFSISSGASAVTWNAYGVHGGSISESSGVITAIAGDTAGEVPNYHWNKSNWTSRTGEKDFYVTSDLNGKSVGCIGTFSWDFVSGYWGNAYFNIMVEDAGGKKAILSPAYNSATSTGWDTTVGSTAKSYCVFEAETGWTGTAATGWYAATWDEVKNLTITDGPFTEFPDTLDGDAIVQDDPVYTVANWAAWADQAAGSDADWEKGGVMITFGQSTGPGTSPDTTVIENIELSILPVHNVMQGTYHATIQAAIDAANPGDTIEVATGTYNENVVVNKSLSLEAGSKPVIDGGQAGACITIAANGVTIDGFEIKNGTNGIVSWDTDDSTIKNCDIHDNLNVGGYNGVGIMFWTGTSTVDFDNNIIANNRIYNNDRQGIYIGWLGSPSTPPTVYSNGNTISGNLIYNNGLCTSSSVPDESEYGIQLCFADDNLIQNNGIYGHNDWWFGQGIYLFASYDNTVSGNNIHDNSYGINLWVDGYPRTIGNNYINCNDIAGNGSGMWNIDGAAVTVDAENNWWGDNSGPSGVGPGTGDAVSDYVDYDPWTLHLTCSGFEPPMDKGAVKVKKNRRVLPLKAQLLADGFVLTDADIIAPPVLQVIFQPVVGDATEVTDDALFAGEGTEGNEFVFSDDKWQFNLKIKNYSSPGTYTITMVSGGECEYTIEPTPTAAFVVQ